MWILSATVVVHAYIFNTVEADAVQSELHLETQSQNQQELQRWLRG